MNVNLNYKRIMEDDYSKDLREIAELLEECRGVKPKKEKEDE